MNAAAINWTLPAIDHLNPSFLNFDPEEKKYSSSECSLPRMPVRGT
jgi:hypothetical protein